MPFKVEEHDVTCLCALVDLPKRVIVEELPPEGGRARFQVQGFTSAAVGELLEWTEPVIKRAVVRRWEGAFAMARIEIRDQGTVEVFRDCLRGLAERRVGGMRVAAGLNETSEGFEAPLRALAELVGS